VYHIDSHLHLGKFNAGIYGRRKKKRNHFLRGTKIGIVSSLGSATIGQQWGNRETFDFVNRFRSRLKKLIWINPYDPEWRKDAEKYVDREECVGIKLHSSLNRYYPTKEILNPVLNFAQTHNLPVVFHTGNSNYCNAKIFTTFIKSFPRITFILYHMSPLEEAIVLCKRFKNVYLEVSGRNIDQVKRAVKECGAGRVIFGSDEHMIYQKKNPHRLLGEIKQSFSQKDQKKILFGNAKRIFKLK